MPKKIPRKPPPLDVQARMDAVLRAIFGSDGSSPVMIDLSDSIQPNQKFQVNLTEHQRQSLVTFCNLGKRLLKKLETAGPGKQVVSVTRKELDELNDQIGSSAHDAPAAHRKRLMLVQKQVAELFAQDHHQNLARHNKKTAAQRSAIARTHNAAYRPQPKRIVAGGSGLVTPHRRTLAPGILPALAANAGSRGMTSPSRIPRLAARAMT